MCGRYLFSMSGADGASQRLRQLWNRQFPETAIPQGEILPGMRAPILVAGDKKLQLLQAKWGYDTGTGVLVNARWETAGEKRTFRDGTPCVIPVSGFYEWSPAKEKYLFQGKEPLLYLAGLCRSSGRELEFVILTQPAGREVRGIHHRMPVLLPQNQLTSWVRFGRTGWDALPEVPLQDGIPAS